MRHGVRHFPALDALRGVAAVLIVLHHFRILSVLDNNLIVHSRLMVDLFFVISGFVIAYQYQQQLQCPRDVIGFQKRRFWRLYPLHLLMLGVFVGIETLKYLAYHVGHVQSIEPGFTSNPPMAILSNLLL
ncbi:MAG: acyltransferase family protein, partial [Phycisphaeraceae bacterium JB051]